MLRQMILKGIGQTSRLSFITSPRILALAAQTHSSDLRLEWGAVNTSSTTIVSSTTPHRAYLTSVVHDRTCVMFRTMQDIGFLNQVRYSVAFCQLLAMPSWHLAHLNQVRSINEHLEFSLSATQALQRQVDDPLSCTSDDAIGAVLVFACSAVRKYSFFASSS